jgi:hypothetical protein
MILQKVLKKGVDFNLPKEILEKAHLMGRVNIVVEKNKIVIRKVSEEVAAVEGMTGLGKGIFDKDSVTLQRGLREEWKL